MLGNAKWFAEKQMGKQISPVTWQGWAYVLGWGGAMAGPFVALLARGQNPEAFLWLTASAAALWRETKTLRTAVRRQSEAELFYIGDDEASRIATENYDFSLKA